ncbi:hypothetical protein [Rhodococcus qingshengii]|uniref:hypothetical protein n=1 Tax=Rhodococcus qingshengii TaxID=334542 RepID=UPI0035DF13E6
MAIEFFDKIFHGMDNGFVAIATGKTRNLDIQYFSWPDAREELQRHITENKHQDVYVVPSLLSSPNRNPGHSRAQRQAVWIDADAMDLAKLRIQPSLVVRTSPDKHHVYWIVGGDGRGLEDLSRAIGKAHEEDGASHHVGNSYGFMRVPGTFNTRSEDFTEVITAGTSVSFDSLQEAYR